MSSTIDKMATDASERLAQQVNRSAGQHLRAMRANAPAPVATAQAHQDPLQSCAREGGNVWYAEPEPFLCADDKLFQIAFAVTTIISLVAVVALGLHLYYRFFN